MWLKDTILMMIIVKSHGKMLLITLIIIMLFIVSIGSWVHLSSEIFISYTFGKFLMSSLSYLGNISYLTSENAGGIIYSVISYYQIFQRLLLVCGFKRKLAWNHTTGTEKDMRTSHFWVGNHGIVIRDLVSFHTFRFFWQSISLLVSSLTTISWSHQFIHSQFSDFYFGLD